MRYFLEISYLGTNYHGWQIQPNAITIQGVLEDCMSKLLKFEIKLVGAGRTDTGVHAIQMFAHFDIDNKIYDGSQMIYKLNSFLPNDIVVKKIFQVNNKAHARFDAVSRSYVYFISREKNPFELNKSYYFKNKLDLKKMTECTNLLFNYVDFKSFSKSRSDVKTYNCEIFNASWEIIDCKLCFKIKADRFLRNMVRAIVGTLIEVGIGTISKDDFEEIINKRDRKLAGYSVPAHALFLKEINYNWDKILVNG